MRPIENDSEVQIGELPARVLLGRRIRDLRTRQGFSLRSLSERSGLNINTLSLVENGKSSPSVSTLQQLAQALGVSISSFFDPKPIDRRVVFTAADQRPLASFGSTRLENLGQGLAGVEVQPFLVTIAAGMGSGKQRIVHTGHEFVYCLSGTLHYQVDDQEYCLNTGDCLVFEAHLPHRWQNHSQENAQVLLIFCPADTREEPGGRHFILETENRS